MKGTATIQKYLDKMNASNVDIDGIQNVIQVLKSGFLSRPEGGLYVKMFQNHMSLMLQKQHCFATSSGTSSLHGAIAALNLGPHDEILVPAIAYIADASVILQEQAKPVFVDIALDDFNLDPEDAKHKITKNTKAIIVVHMYGQPAKLDPLISLARKHNLVIIEDCAQAAGAQYKGRPVGSFGDISCFSFYQTKHIVCGEGGLICTDNKKYADTLRSILNNGIKRENLDEYNYDHVGFNYQMTEMQAALALRQIQRLEELNSIRRKYANIYKEIFCQTDILFQQELPDTQNVYCYLTGLLPKSLGSKRDAFIKKILEKGIPIKKQYPLPLPETDIMQSVADGYKTELPFAHSFAKRVFNMYVHPGLEEHDIYHFARQINGIYKNLARTSI